jgi:hypothetical protein
MTTMGETMTQDIRDKHGALLAKIRTRSDGNDEIRDRHGRLLGTYNPATNDTRDANGSLIAKGNALTSLIVPD